MKTSMLRAAGGTVDAGGLMALRPGTRANKLVRQAIRHLSRQLRHTAGRLEGLNYRLAGRRPDPNVVDTVLADRVRSQLGALEKQLDLPHVHVTAEDHVVLLGGDVATGADSRAVEETVAGVSGVSGVQGVRNHPHVGLADGDTRPSEGHTRGAV
jgi:osmotically-inducible protein OsmY